VRLRVVAGPRHEEFWRGGTDSRITVHGFVEDLRPLYARALAVAVPLAVSAGTNIKVLEAMACGKAIVSTPPGCAGLGLHDSSELLIREEWPAFAEALSRAATDAGLRKWLGQAARTVAEERFSWDAIAGEAWRSYLRVSTRERGAEGVANIRGKIGQLAGTASAREILPRCRAALKTRQPAIDSEIFSGF